MEFPLQCKNREIHFLQAWPTLQIRSDMKGTIVSSNMIKYQRLQIKKTKDVPSPATWRMSVPVNSVSLLYRVQCSKKSSGKLTWPELGRTHAAFFFLPASLATSSAPGIVIVSVNALHVVFSELIKVA